MSIICSACGINIQQPETVWYAGTKYSWNVQYVCGTCLDLIPEEERHAANKLREYDITFGVLYATVNSRGWYQQADSGQGPVHFWVKSQVLVSVFSKDVVLTDNLYPYYDPERYCKEIAEAGESGRFNDSKEKNNLNRSLTVYGPFLESFWNVDKTKTIVRQNLSPYDIPNPLVDQKLLKLADELYQDILSAYGSQKKPSASPPLPLGSQKPTEPPSQQINTSENYDNSGSNQIPVISLQDLLKGIMPPGKKLKVHKIHKAPLNLPPDKSYTTDSELIDQREKEKNQMSFSERALVWIFEKYIGIKLETIEALSSGVYSDASVAERLDSYFEKSEAILYSLNEWMKAITGGAALIVAVFLAVFGEWSSLGWGICVALAFMPAFSRFFQPYGNRLALLPLNHMVKRNTLRYLYGVARHGLYMVFLIIGWFGICYALFMREEYSSNRGLLSVWTFCISILPWSFMAGDKKFSGGSISIQSLTGAILAGALFAVILIIENSIYLMDVPILPIILLFTAFMVIVQVYLAYTVYRIINAGEISFNKGTD